MGLALICIRIAIDRTVVHLLTLDESKVKRSARGWVRIRNELAAKVGQSSGVSPTLRLNNC